MLLAINGKAVVELDKGADRDTRPAKPCCRRFAPGQWCHLADGHAGACEGPAARPYTAPDFGPPAARPYTAPDFGPRRLK